PPCPTHARRRYAVAGGHTAEDESLLDVVGVAPPSDNARGLLRGIIQRPAHLARVETGSASRSSRGAECPGDAMGGETALIAELGTAHRQHDAGTYVVTEGHGAKEARPVDTNALVDGEHCGDSPASAMRTRGV